jgi:hypothetical protein
MLEKNPPMTVNKVRHSSLSYQIFAMQVKAATQVYYVRGHRLSAEKEQGICVNQLFFPSL